MLLTIDIGNSNIVFGVFEKTGLLGNEIRIKTEKKKPTSHYLPFVKNISTKYKITDVAISSVVPELDETLSDITKKTWNTTPFFASSKLQTTIPNLTKKESHLGADRLCNIVYAIHKSTGNRIVVDLGTATKFEVVSIKNEYLGGAIAPGVGDSFTSLLSHASKLPDLTLSTPKKVVGGFDTKEHLDSGFVFGFASMIDGMIEKIVEEQQLEDVIIFITGGFSELISPHITHSVTLNKTLTLEGLNILWSKNQ